jgi:NTP pyrophosphatase (non-canonical NTP hydrolase)
MDTEANIHDLKEKVRKFCEERDWDKFHNAKELAIGMSIECSELLDLFRYKSEKEVDEMFADLQKREKISEELVDILHCLLRLSQRYDIDLSEELSKKMAKSEKKYPVEKAKGSNKKYDEL